MKKFLGAMTKSSAVALTLTMGLSIGVAHAGGVFDPVPGQHGGSAGFVEFNVFSASQNEDDVTSILSNDSAVDGLVTLDQARDLTTHVDIDAVPLSNGRMTGMVTLRVMDDGGTTLVRTVPITAAGHRFREGWKRDYRDAPSSLDGELTRAIRHAVAIKAIEDGSGALLRGITDPDLNNADSRFDVAPWIGILRTKVTDINNDASPDIPGRVTGGASDLVFSGGRDAAQWWEILEGTVTAVNSNTVHVETNFFNPYIQDLPGRAVVVDESGDALIKVLPYNTTRDLPGKYAVLYRNFDAPTGRSGLFQTGWLVATGGEINNAIANDRLSVLLFGDDDEEIDGTVFDTRFICVSPAARTTIDSVRDPFDLVRPDAPSN